MRCGTAAVNSERWTGIILLLVNPPPSDGHQANSPYYAPHPDSSMHNATTLAFVGLHSINQKFKYWPFGEKNLKFAQH